MNSVRIRLLLILVILPVYLWSLDFEQTATAELSGNKEPAIMAQLDDDPMLEVVVQPSQDGLIATFDHDGSSLWTFQTGWYGALDVADADNDGYSEIGVLSADKNFYYLDHLGNEVWKYAIRRLGHGLPKFCQLDADANLEIVCGEWDSGTHSANTAFVYAFDPVNEVLEWEYAMKDDCVPNAMDLDGDGLDEVVVYMRNEPTYTPDIVLLNADGTEKWKVSEAAWGEVRCLDYNEDGKKDIIVNDTGPKIINFHDGAELSADNSHGHLLEVEEREDGHRIYTSESDKLSCLNTGFSIVWTFDMPPDNSDPHCRVFDIDGNGKNEVLIAPRNGDQFWWVDEDNNILTHAYLEDGHVSAPRLPANFGDFSGDGIKDLVLSDGTSYLYYYEQKESNTNLDSGLIAYYPFNGNADDESGNGNHGIVNGAVLTVDRFENDNSAYYFSSLNSETRIDADINTSSIQTGLTIALWVMRLGDGTISPRLFEFYSPDDRGTAVINWRNDEEFIIIYSTTSTGYRCESWAATSKDSIWTHLVYTNDGQAGKFYQDGILIDSVYSEGDPILGGDVAFGRMNHWAWDAFNGKLDDIRIYNRAISLAEVQNLYGRENEKVHRVPSQYATIQEAIDASSIGDTVLVAAGTYTGQGNKDLDFKGKDIVLISENGPESTIIDCQNDGRGLFFQNGETRDAVVSGFTITGASSCGIECINYSSPTIFNNIIKNNTTHAYGGGIRCRQSEPLIERNLIYGNTASEGGGIYGNTNSAPIIRNCTIVDNAANRGQTANPYRGGGLCFWDSSTPMVENCIIWNNSANYGPQISSNTGSVITINYSDVEDGWAGQGLHNISDDPEFVNSEFNDYRLAGNSPCIDAGNPDSPKDPDGSTADIGYFIYEPLSYIAFEKVTEGAIVNDGGYSDACAWGDYNNDQFIDLFIVNNDEDNFLYTNNGDGTFTKKAQGDIVTDGGNGRGNTFGDYNNDGYLDLYVTNSSQSNCLYKNNGDGTFTKITEGEIVSDNSRSSAAAWGDYNNDGYLDLFVANYADQNNFLFENNGDETFTKIVTGEIVNDGGDAQGCGWTDYDNDGFLDLYVTNENQPNFLYKNLGNGNFTKISEGAIVTDIEPSGGCSWGDYDNDGFSDVFVTNFVNHNNSLYHNNGDGTFTKITEGIVVNDGGKSHGSTWGDFDNNGWIDLFVSNNGDVNFLYLNDGYGAFTKVMTGDIVNGKENSRGTACCDYDNDGDLDIMIANGWSVSQNNCLFANSGNSNNWINIRVVGTVSNVSAIGTKLKIIANLNGGKIKQVNEVLAQTGGMHGGQNSLNAEFGLADAGIIDSLIIQWPSGIVDTYTNINCNQFLTATEGQGLTDLPERYINQPEEFALLQNYPNPFNPNTTIQYNLTKAGKISIKIFNILGQEILTLLNTNMSAGKHSIKWDGTDTFGHRVPSGLYLYQLIAEDFVQTKKMILAK